MQSRIIRSMVLKDYYLYYVHGFTYKKELVSISIGFKKNKQDKYELRFWCSEERFKETYIFNCITLHIL